MCVPVPPQGGKAKEGIEWKDVLEGGKEVCLDIKTNMLL